MTAEGIDKSTAIRVQFTELLETIEKSVPAHNARYLALVKTKLEEACMFAVKGIAVTANS